MPEGEAPAKDPGGDRLEVCVLVFNPFVHDARVLRTGVTLAEHGCRVTVIATPHRERPEREQLGELTILRPVLRSLLQRAFAGPSASVAGLPLAASAGAVAAPAQIDEGPRRAGGAARKRSAARTFAAARIVRRSAQWMLRAARRLQRAVAWRSRRALRRVAKAPLRPFARPLRYWEYYRQAANALDGRRCDVVHANDLNTLPAGWWIARRHRAGLVYDSHELFVDRNRLPPRTVLNRFLVSTIERLLIRRCDAVITVGESLARVLAERYGVATPEVVRNTPALALDHAAVSPSLRQLLSIDPSRAVVLYCGYLTIHRGLPHLIRSLHYLPQCHLVLLGDGPKAYASELDQLAGREGVAARYSRFAPVPPDEVIAYAACADVGVAPIEDACLSYRYCSPNKLFEYLHAGLPVVASDFPDLRAVIERHGAGALCDPRDPRDIARAITEVLELDAAELQAMKLRIREAAELYCWERESEKLLSIYRRLAAERAPTAAS